MLRVLTILLILALLAWRITAAFSPSGGDEYPNRPIHVVVPYTAGGGTDTFARIIQGALTEQKLLPQPIVIQNQPGGSGTIGSRYVKNAPPDGYKILCHHESIITANVSGTVAFGPEAFAPIAQTGNIVLLILVREDAPYKSVTDLLEHAKVTPPEVNFGANVGSPGHFTGMQLEEAFPGAQLNFITSGGGQKRFTQLIGGHLQAGIFSLAEYRAFRAANDTPPDQNIRALAILEPERHPELPDVPTCHEAGLEVTSSNAFYWWAPKDTAPEVVQTLATALKKATASDKVRGELDKLAIGPVFRSDEELMARLDERVATISQLDVRSETKLPNFPLYTAAIVGVLAVLVAAGSFRRPKSTAHSKDQSAQISEDQRCKRTAKAVTPTSNIQDRTSLLALPSAKTVICFLIVCAYVAALQSGLIPFVLATLAMIFLTGAVITNWSRLVPLTLLALLTSLGSEFIFTKVFTVPLP